MTKKRAHSRTRGKRGKGVLSWIRKIAKKGKEIADANPELVADLKKFADKKGITSEINKRLGPATPEKELLKKLGAKALGLGRKRRGKGARLAGFGARPAGIGRKRRSRKCK